MAIRDIVYVKDNSEFLHTASDPVDPDNISSDEIQTLIDDMIETKDDADGVGIAAVQIGVHKRITIVEMPNEGPTAFINPQISDRSEDMVEAEEGCLSIPDVYGMVERHREVTITALDRKGDEIKLRAKGMPAVIFQHEIDHMDGILFTDPERLIKYTRGPKM